MKTSGMKAALQQGQPGNQNHQRSLTVIFKGLDKCNADCAYCSVGHTDGRVMLPEQFEVVAAQLEQLVNSRGIHRLTFTFHGGEPTLLAPEFVDSICRRIGQLAPVVKFNMQSNLIRLPPTLLEVLEAHQVHVGTSVDPLGVDRVDRSGRNLFWPWLRNYVMLARRGVAPGAIYVVTRNSLEHAERIYDVCEAIGNLAGTRFSLQVNHIYEQGKASDPDCELTTGAEAFGDFLVELWKIWEERGRTISLGPIGLFSDYFRRRGAALPEGLLCSFAGSCAQSHVGIDLDGNVAGCGRRLDSKAFLGNLEHQNLTDILADGEELKLISERARNLERDGPCADCEFFGLCHGGCPDDAALGPEGLSGRFPLCAAYQKLFRNMAADIHKLSRPPRRIDLKDQRHAAPPRLVLARKVEDLPRDPDRRCSVWMLPDQDGGWLGFDSGLDQALRALGPRRVRLWIHNRQARSLMLWEDLLRRPGLEVALFESEGLDRAVNLLNSLGATIALDPVSIAADEGGFAQLRQAVERLVGDPLWQSQVSPFSWMVRAVLENAPAVLNDGVGLRPGSHLATCEIEPTAGTPAARLLASVHNTLDSDPASWLEQRQGCLECPYLRPCGSSMWTDPERGCLSQSFRLVEQVVSVARGMRQLLPRVATGS